MKIKLANRLEGMNGGSMIDLLKATQIPGMISVLKQRISEYEFIEDGKAIVVKWDYDNSVDYWLTFSNKQVFSGKKLVGKTKIVKD